MSDNFNDKLTNPLTFKSVFSSDTSIGINLLISRGTLNLIVGAENSGKSDLCKKIAGLDNKVPGQILFYGKKLDQIKMHNLLLYIPSGNIFFENRTVLENLVILGELSNIPIELIEKRIKNIMPIYGLNIIKKIKLSKLPKSTVSILNLSIIEIIKPEIVILSTQDFFGDQLKEDFYFNRLNYLKNSGLTIFTATQRFRNIKYADNIILLSESKPIFAGNPQKLLKVENPKEIELILLKKIEESYETI